MKYCTSKTRKCCKFMCVVQCTSILSIKTQKASLPCTALHCTAPHCTALSVLYCLYCTVLHCTTLFIVLSALFYCTILHCALGWVDIGTRTWVPLECIHFYVKVPKTAIKSFLVKWPFEERSFFLGSGTL
jgi:hypothetical protein